MSQMETLIDFTCYNWAYNWIVENKPWSFV